MSMSICLTKYQQNFTRKISPSYFKIHFLHCLSKGYSNLIWKQAKA